MCMLLVKGNVFVAVLYSVVTFAYLLVEQLLRIVDLFVPCTLQLQLACMLFCWYLLTFALSI